ncbi:heme-degrading monooxygenase HmoA [Streptomyces sp. V3I8]|uniref:antibiotic biosynthesis monooxygenase family protein n=1 Tax=Streptomyces sp. V3I8 TaxID=3042279 RepID=UPI00277F2B3F|nr:antibiotic biosynthesis monooxygenase family protein [Streptomyces sp. V3I8]MDQ1041650.1 heme-degrading monooxygenase HmoA [Streptomyces sp. V3I8]
MTFRVMLRMEIRPGTEDAFEREWHEGTAAVTGHPANLGQWLARSTAAPCAYYIVSDWVDESGFRAFESGTAHVAHRERLHVFRAGATFDTMRVVSHIPGRASDAG